MAASALGQEKVWLDKTSYDKAERLHHEKLAKVLPQKTEGDINTCALNEGQDRMNSISAPKTKTKKTKDNKVVSQDVGMTDTSKNSKNLKKSNKKKESSSTGNSKVNESSVSIELIDSHSAVSTAVDTKKCKAKEAKEKKNKADKKHKNSENDGCNLREDSLNQGGQSSVCSISAGGSLANEVAKARQHIKQSLQCMDGIAALAGVSDKDLVSRVVSLEKENQDLRNIVQELKSIVLKLDGRVKSLEGQSAKGPAQNAKPALQICPQKPAAKDDDEDVDLFGSDSEEDDAEAAKIREERLAAYAAKKSNKPVLIAKSNIILDIKPWDDETDMKAMEKEVRTITADGLLWGAAKLVPVAYKIQKLQISCVVEDDKVSVDWLTEKIEEFEDFVQSVDIAAFNKV